MIYDKHAVRPGDISVKLRGPDNGKLPRTPYNIASAIEMLFQEYLTLQGGDQPDVGPIFESLLTQVAEWRAKAMATASYAMPVRVGVEMLINFDGQEPYRAFLNTIAMLEELRDINEDKPISAGIAGVITAYKPDRL